MSKVAELVEAEDWDQLITIALNARALAGEGKFCECNDPAVTGVDLMCGDCLRENREQIKKRTQWMADPHPFESYARAPFMCRRCSMWEDDPRHTDA